MYTHIHTRTYTHSHTRGGWPLPSVCTSNRDRAKNRRCDRTTLDSTIMQFLDTRSSPLFPLPGASAVFRRTRDGSLRRDRWTRRDRRRSFRSHQCGFDANPEANSTLNSVAITSDSSCRGNVARILVDGRTNLKMRNMGPTALISAYAPMPINFDTAERLASERPKIAGRFSVERFSEGSRVKNAEYINK